MKTNHVEYSTRGAINVESENGIANDYRAGLEVSMLRTTLFVGAEVYYIMLASQKTKDFRVI